MVPSFSEGFDVTNVSGAIKEECIRTLCCPAMATAKIRGRCSSDVSNINISGCAGYVNSVENTSEQGSHQADIIHLQQEIACLKACLAEKEAILDSTKHEVQKLLSQYYKTVQQNKQLAQANSQMFAELSMTREKFKLLDHEYKQMTAAFKHRRKEYEETITDLTMQLKQKNMIPEGTQHGINNTRLHVMLPDRSFQQIKSKIVDGKKEDTLKVPSHIRGLNQSYILAPETSNDEHAGAFSCPQIDKHPTSIRDEASLGLSNHVYHSEGIKKLEEVEAGPTCPSTMPKRCGTDKDKASRRRKSNIKVPSKQSHHEASFKLLSSQEGKMPNTTATGLSVNDMEADAENENPNKRRLRKTINLTRATSNEPEDFEDAYQGAGAVDNKSRGPSHQNHRARSSDRDRKEEALTPFDTDSQFEEKLSSVDVSTGGIQSIANNSLTHSGFQHEENLKDGRPSLRRRTMNICYKEPSLVTKLRRTTSSESINFFIRADKKESQVGHTNKLQEGKPLVEGSTDNQDDDEPISSELSSTNCTSEDFNKSAGISESEGTHRGNIIEQQDKRQHIAPCSSGDSRKSRETSDDSKALFEEDCGKCKTRVRQDHEKDETDPFGALSKLERGIDSVNGVKQQGKLQNTSPCRLATSNQAPDTVDDSNASANKGIKGKTEDAFRQEARNCGQSVICDTLEPNEFGISSTTDGDINKQNPAHYHDKKQLESGVGVSMPPADNKPGVELKLQPDEKPETESLDQPTSTNASFDAKVAGSRRSSAAGRPLRKAAEVVHSYKEIPINVKMRRPA